MKNNKKKNRFYWIRKGEWSRLTRGEKVGRVALKIVKYALIGGAVAVIAAIVIGSLLGVIIAFAMADAIAGGFKNASRANTGELYGHYKW